MTILDRGADRYFQLAANNVADSLAPDKVSDEFVRFYLTELRENWRDAQKTISRSIALILLLMAGFELLRQDSKAEVTVAFIKVSDPFPILIALPVLIAYQFLRLIVAQRDSAALHGVHHAVVSFRYPSVSDKALDMFMVPGSSFEIQSFRAALYHQPSRVGRAPWTVAYLNYLAVMFGTLVFEWYAYRRLGIDYSNAQPIAFRVSQVIAVVLVSAALLVRFSIVPARKPGQPGWIWKANRLRRKRTTAVPVPEQREDSAPVEDTTAPS